MEQIKHVVILLLFSYTDKTRSHTQTYKQLINTVFIYEQKKIVGGGGNW